MVQLSENVKVDNKQVFLDCLKNMLGVLNTPFGRKKLTSSQDKKTLDIATDLNENSSSDEIIESFLALYALLNSPNGKKSFNSEFCEEVRKESKEVIKQFNI